MNFSERIARQLGRARQIFSDLRSRGALRARFADIDSSVGLDDFLKDIGLSRTEMERIVRGSAEAERLLPAMTKRLGVDIEKLSPAQRYRLGKACATCRSHRRCRRWLAAASNESTGYGAFCPNAELFDAALGRAS